MSSAPSQIINLGTANKHLFFKYGLTESCWNVNHLKNIRESLFMPNWHCCTEISMTGS